MHQSNNHNERGNSVKQQKKTMHATQCSKTSRIVIIYHMCVLVRSFVRPFVSFLHFMRPYALTHIISLLHYYIRIFFCRIFNSKNKHKDVNCVCALCGWLCCFSFHLSITIPIHAFYHIFSRVFFSIFFSPFIYFVRDLHRTMDADRSCTMQNAIQSRP